MEAVCLDVALHDFSSIKFVQQAKEGQVEDDCIAQVTEVVNLCSCSLPLLAQVIGEEAEQCDGHCCIGFWGAAAT